MNSKIKALTNIVTHVAIWLERRLHLVKIWEATAGHPIPKSSASWFYVFGSMTMLCLTLQILTGILLSFVYVPSACLLYTSDAADE